MRNLKRFFQIYNPILLLDGKEVQRQTRYVRWAVIAVMVPIAGTLLMLLLGKLPYQPFRFWAVVFGLAINTAVLLLLRSRKPGVALWVMGVGYWAVVTVVVFMTGGVHSPWLMGQLALIVFTGLVAGVPGGVVLGGLTVIVDIGLIWLDHTGVFLLPVYDPPMLESIGALIVNVGFTVLMIVIVRQLAIDSLRRVRSDERLYRALFEKTNDAVFIISMDRTYLDANQQAVDLLGYSLEELVGMPVQRVVVPEERSSSSQQVKRLDQEGMLPVYERTVVCKDGSRKTVEVNLALVRDQNDEPLHYQSVVRDVSERKRLERQLRDSLSEMEDIAMSDPLTGTLNRRAIMDYADAEWHRSHRENRPMCLMLIDVDNLKAVNDKYGHLAGDKALQTLVEAVNFSKRRYDWIGRWGGDEFLMVLPGANLVEAQDVAARLRTIIRETDFGFGGEEEDKLKVSLGVACYSGRKGEETPLNRLLAQADAALYEAKESGRDQLAVYRD